MEVYRAAVQQVPVFPDLLQALLTGRIVVVALTLRFVRTQPRALAVLMIIVALLHRVATLPVVALVQVVALTVAAAVPPLLAQVAAVVVPAEEADDK